LLFFTRWSFDLIQSHIWLFNFTRELQFYILIGLFIEFEMFPKFLILYFSLLFQQLLEFLFELLSAYTLDRTFLCRNKTVFLTSFFRKAVYSYKRPIGSTSFRKFAFVLQMLYISIPIYCSFHFDGRIHRSFHFTYFFLLFLILLQIKNVFFLRFIFFGGEIFRSSPARSEWNEHRSFLFLAQRVVLFHTDTVFHTDVLTIGRFHLDFEEHTLAHFFIVRATGINKFSTDSQLVQLSFYPI